MRQKPPSQLANTRGGRGRGLAVVIPERRIMPRMPSPPSGLRWSAKTRALWRSFWRSPVSVAVDVNADAERLFRWLEATEERERLLAEVRKHGYAPAREVLAQQEDENGNTAILLLAGPHPHLAYIKHLDKEIARLSDHFGMTPLSRFRLQLTFSESKRSELALHREAAPPPQAVKAEVLDLDELA